MTEGSGSNFRFTAVIPNLDEVLAAAREGELEPASRARFNLRAHRAEVMIAFTVEKDPRRAAALNLLLNEARQSDRDLTGALRDIQDDRHADRMAALAATSNAIADRSEQTAPKLVGWTQGLVVATVVLALATIALVLATVALVQQE